MSNTMDMPMQMSFYWSNKATILFSGWPNPNNSSIYFLGLLFVFVLAFVVEALSAANARRPKPTTTTTSIQPITTNPLAVGFGEAVVHTIRVGLGYLLMLAVMSFNGGVFIAVVAGHALGFFLVKATAIAFPHPSQSPMFE